jgi:hypothetical protein
VRFRGTPRLFGAVVATALILLACSPTRVEERRETEQETPERPAEAETFAWPDPSPSRPVVDLSFTLSEDLRSVEGVKRIEFTPDLDICELVFRLWPNKPFTAARGNELVVTDVVVDEQAVESTVIPAGAPDGAAGTLLDVTLPACVSAGTTLGAELDFTLTLGEGTNERVGVSSAGDMAWFGTAFPLLAWENGRGWAREPAVNVAGETATSETFRLRSLEVVAASRYQVMGTGQHRGSRDQQDQATTRHRFSASAVRDVAVTVGLLDVRTREVEGVRLHLGAPQRGTQAPLSSWGTKIERSLRQVADRLGPVPYEDVWVSVIPDQTSGIEFPGALQFGDVSPDDQTWLVTHEVAHLWFYGLVGNNQARDPWLDEAFATFVQLLVDGEDPREASGDLRPLSGRVGRPMTYWATRERPSSSYFQGVYQEGAAALLEAREQAGEEQFDAAMIDYLVENAHRIAAPEDVEAAFSELPDAVLVLRRAGALPAAS